MIGNVAGKVLQVFPGAARIQNVLVEVGAEMPARKPTSSSGLSPQFLPCVIVIEAERGVPDRRNRRVHCGHAFIVNDCHGGGSSVF